jgi:hypothetical protein
MRRWNPSRLILGLALVLVAGIHAGRVTAQPPPPRDEESKTVRGTVREFTTAPKGEVDGMILSDGTEVHWPPHLGDKVTALVSKNDRVKVSGWLHTTPQGDTHLRAGTILNLRNDASLNVEDLPERVGRPGKRGRPGPDRPGDVEERLRALENKLDRLAREVERLPREK